MLGSMGRSLWTLNTIALLLLGAQALTYENTGGCNVIVFTGGASVTRCNKPNVNLRYRCSLLVLQGNVEKGVKECSSIPDTDLNKVIETSYGSRLQNVPGVIDFLSLLSPDRQLTGYKTLLDLMNNKNETSNGEMLKIAFNLHQLEADLDDRGKDTLKVVKESIPSEIRQIFWHDWCVISHHTRLYEYLYIDDNPDQYGKILTYTQGDGNTLPVGHWKLDPTTGKEGHQIVFRISNRNYQGQYLAQRKDNSERIDCNQRYVISARTSIMRSEMSQWELKPELNACQYCFRIRNTGLSTTEYIFTPPGDTPDDRHRNSRAGIPAIIAPGDDLWEVQCWTGSFNLRITKKT